MNSIFDKLKAEINKRIAGYEVSLKEHQEDEAKLNEKLANNIIKQDKVIQLIEAAEDEIQDLQNYHDWKNAL